MSDNNTTSQAEFKPSDKPYLVFGNEVLNNNIPWSEVLREVHMKSGMTLAQIAARLQTSINNLGEFVNGNNCPISFKQGARLLTMLETARARYAKQ